ncbi:hypothetical protein HDU91_003199 [Kappamyces sp. JEL0680]|nr:hypothetical protein HDU91_003199 [Kappamyces sp. JEL0680]
MSLLFGSKKELNDDKDSEAAPVLVAASNPNLTKDFASLMAEPDGHRGDLDGPASRADHFKVFSPNAIKSSLKRFPSAKLSNHAQPQVVDAVPPAEPGPPAAPETKTTAAPSLPLDIPLESQKIQQTEKITILINENDRLLQETLAQAHEIDELQAKLKATTKRAHYADQELAGASGQLQSLQEHLDEQTELARKVERQLKFGNDEIASKDAEIDHANGLLHKKQRELDHFVLKNEELLQALSDLSERYKDVVREASVASKREKELLQDIEAKTEAVEELGCSVAEYQKGLETIKDQLETQQAITKNMERKIQLSEKKEIEYLETSQKQAQEVEEALYQRDSALKREQLLLKEIDHLNQKCVEQPKLYKEKNELALQTLVDAPTDPRLRTQFSHDRRQWVEETLRLEELCTSLQSQTERAMREKRAAESELDKLTRHIPAEADRLTMAMEEMHSKLCASERERHEAMQKLESLHQKTLRDQNQYESERHQANERIEDSYRRLRRLEREIEDGKTDAMQLQQTIATLEQDKKAAHENIRLLTSSHESQTKAAATKYEAQIADVTAKLESVSEAHATTCRDMQQLLASQRAMGEKWKDESEHIRDHYEKLIAKLKKELGQFQSRVGELETLVQKSTIHRRDLMDQVAKEKHLVSQWQEKHLAVQKQNDALHKQVSALLEKEVEMLNERKKLGRPTALTAARDLDRAILDNQSRKKDSKTARTKLRSYLLENEEGTDELKMTQKLEQDIERIQKRTARNRHLTNVKPVDVDVDASD